MKLVRNSRICHSQRPPSAHSNQQKQSLMGEAHAWLVQKQQQQHDFQALQQEIQSNLLHSQQGFFPASFRHHPHVQYTSNRSRKPDHLATPVSNSNVIATGSQHPQIKSSALAQTTRLGTPVTLVHQTMTVKRYWLPLFQMLFLKSNFQSDGFEVEII